MRSVRELMGPVLGAVADRTGSTAALEAVWRQAAGEVAARHTRVRRIEGTTLVVWCDDVRWREGLEREQASLLAKLTATLGRSTLRAFRFEVE